jgi:hypothetical protein
VTIVIIVELVVVCDSDGSGNNDPTALASSEGLNFSWTCNRRVTQSPCFAGSALSSTAQLVVPYSRLAQALLIEDSSAGPFDFTVCVLRKALGPPAPQFLWWCRQRRVCLCRC